MSATDETPNPSEVTIPGVNPDFESDPEKKYDEDDPGYRALTQDMIIVPVTDGWVATETYHVFSASMSEYDVTAQFERGMPKSVSGSCMDAQFNRGEGESCKHGARVQHAVVETDLPAPREDAGPYLDKFLDAEDDLRAIKDAIEADDGGLEVGDPDEGADLSEQRARNVKNAVKAIDYIHDELDLP